MDSTAADTPPGQPAWRSRLIRWLILAGLSVVLTWVLARIGVPAALLLGPMLAGIVLAARGLTVAVPRPCFLASQAVIGCLIARHFEPGLFALLARDWPIFAGVTLLIFAASFALGYVLMRSGAVPGNAAIWGAAPGGAAPMVILADAHGADTRLVAVITYMRVLVVVAVASILLTFLGGDQVVQAGAAFWEPVEPAALGTTLLVAIGGVALGLALRIPAGPMIGAIVIGTALSWSTDIVLLTPAPLLAAAYAFIGWRIGLTFSRAAMVSAARSLPWIILSSLTLVAFCAMLGGVLVWQLGIDPVTAYLATSPGGLDSIAIMAVSTHSDTSLVMSLQAVRFLLALSLGSRVAIWLAKKT